MYQTGVSHPKKEGFPQHSKNFGWGWGMAILFSWMGKRMGIALLVAPKHSHPQIQCSNLSFDGLICAQQPGGDVGAGFGQSWLKSVAFLSSILCHHMYRDGRQDVAPEMERN